MISFSTDVYHQRAIPLENVKNGVWAAKQAGRLYNVAVCTDNQENPQFKQTMTELHSIVEDENIRVAITFPVGRAQKYAAHLTYETTTEPTPCACDTANSPVVFPDGNVIACIGPILTLPPTHPLHLGNLRQERLQEILDRAEMNPFLHTIRTWGPKKLIELLKDHGQAELLPKEYVKDCVCDGCYKLLSNKQIVEALTPILQDEKNMKILAYARVYYQNETTMVKRLNL